MILPKIHEYVSGHCWWIIPIDPDEDFREVIFLHPHLFWSPLEYKYLTKEFAEQTISKYMKKHLKDLQVIIHTFGLDLRMLEHMLKH